jgi:hypothetical protein
MTEENQKLLEEILKSITKEFNANIKILRCMDRNKTYKKLVIEYAQQERQIN